MEISDLPLGTAKKMSWAVIASSQTTEDQHGYFVNTSAGTYTLRLPESPRLGTLVSIGDGSGNAETNNITIDRNGSLIEGGTSNQVISTDDEVLTFTYSGSLVGWKVVSTVQSSGLRATETEIMYCFCGSKDSSRVDTTSSYDFSSWTDNLSSAPYALYGNASGSRGPYVISYGGTDSGGTTRDYCWEYDGSTWHTRNTIQPARRDATGATLNGIFYCVFGYGGGYLIDCDKYDGYAWTSSTDGPTPGRYGSGTFVLSDLIYSCFGWTGSVCKDVDYFNGSTWTSAPSSSVPDPARYTSFGGTVDNIGYCGYGYGSDYLADFDGYDGSSWSTNTALAPARTWPQCGVIRNNLIYSGGAASSGYILDCDSYNGSSWLSRDNITSNRRHGGCGGI